MKRRAPKDRTNSPSPVSTWPRWAFSRRRQASQAKASYAAKNSTRPERFAPERGERLPAASGFPILCHLVARRRSPRVDGDAQGSQSVGRRRGDRKSEELALRIEA
jgi:hypothetical protein